MCVAFLLESLVLLINYKSTENKYFRKSIWSFFVPLWIYSSNVCVLCISTFCKCCSYEKRDRRRNEIVSGKRC